LEYITFVGIFFALIFDKLNIFLFLIISSVIHEIGHITACLLFGIKPKLRISVFGAKLYNCTTSSVKKLFILMCGPLANLWLVLIAMCFLHTNFSLKLYIFMCINIVLFMFNILPVHFLDGGQILLLLTDNKITRNVMDIVSFIILFLSVYILSNNIYSSAFALIIFAIYYYINKNGLHMF